MFEKYFIKNNVIRALLFLSAIVIVFIVSIGRNGNSYYFEEGKPWVYGLLTAPYNFPVYKGENELKEEREALMAGYRPYFDMDESIKSAVLSQLDSDYQSVLKSHWSASTYNYVRKSLLSAYNEGIVTKIALDSINSLNVNVVYICRNEIAEEELVPSLKTQRMVYSSILDNSPNEEVKKELTKVGFADYVKPNLSFNNRRSNESFNDLMNSIPTSKGMVQAKEKVIDRGEIVTPEIYDILKSFQIEETERNDAKKVPFFYSLSNIFLIMMGYSFLYLYLYFFRRELFYNFSCLTFITAIVTIFVLIMKIVVKFDLFSVYIIPFAIIPILMSTFFDTRTAFFSFLICILICSFSAIDNSFRFLLVQISVGIVSILGLKNINKRSQLLKNILLVFCTYIFAYTTSTIILGGEVRGITWTEVSCFVVNGMLVTSSYFLFSVAEKFLGYVSDVTLMELSNIDNPIFHEFAEKCPGSFEHSLRVSNLASSISEAIGGNTILTRTGALYHDIGKLSAPSYFTENQRSGFNPHNGLEFDESAHIIISHVTSGLEIAEKIGLPDAIKGFIRTHHGKGKAWYFYNSYKNKYPDQSIDEAKFTYPRPNPYSKETAIVMMADCVEAASRSLKEYTEENFKNLVEGLFCKMMSEKLLNDAPITFKEIEIIKGLFVEKLKIAYHTRVTYPTLQLRDTDKINKGIASKVES
ncbi:MAG TPA: hydrolase [Porphyromonadaceae bacterium]|nr:hydrolase [Porphyromonadaceae bacterium]